MGSEHPSLEQRDRSLKGPLVKFPGNQNAVQVKEQPEGA